jgi:hypothetical protein
MNCRCDEFQFPLETQIPPGLSRLPRQTGTFAEFRRALLRGESIRTTALLETHPLWSERYLTERDRAGLKKSLDAIGQWHGRHPQDFGMLLLEMWAYVCDLTSFYDDVFAHESYLRTARRRESLRKLVDQVGYIPRPPIAALAKLTAFADGRQVVRLPIGTAFRSGAFSGSPPQVFEIDKETRIHPLLNEWSLLPLRPTTFGANGAPRETFLCESGSVSVKEGDFVLVKIGADRYAATVMALTEYRSLAGQIYTQVRLSSPVTVPANTPVNSVQFLKPAATAALWTRSSPAFGPLSSTAAWLYLDVMSSGFNSGDDVILEKTGDFRTTRISSVVSNSVQIEAAQIVEIKDSSNQIISRIPLPAVNGLTTQLQLETNVFIQSPSWTAGDAGAIRVHFKFIPAGRVACEALSEMHPNDQLLVRAPIEQPRDASPPGTFQLEDKNGFGLTRPGSLNFSNGRFTIQGDPWPQSLVTPVKLFGNIITTSRGETVNGEFIGSGDGTIANQSFHLKKSPLTYVLASSENTPSGLSSTLKVYIDGLHWTEVPSFYRRSPEEEVYTVRQDDKGESVVTFGDGVRGRRLHSGAAVVAYYRYGGGAAMPPAGSITQISKPVKGLKGVRSPVAPYGGADAEPAKELQKYAPRSALLLGRAVSLPDFEAAAASYSGVRAVAAEWRWSATLQVPAAHIWYLADGDLSELLRNRLRSLTQPDTPLQVERAEATPARLSIQLVCDPKRFEAEVLLAARAALTDSETGLLAPEQLGIGKPLYRSKLFECLLRIPGVTAITGLSYGDMPFPGFGVKSPAGTYFDVTDRLYINGRNA